MNAISFTGRKLYNGIIILGDPMQERTSANEDINYLNSISDSLQGSGKTSLKRECLGTGASSFKNENYHFLFDTNDGFSNYRKIFIKDLKENITRIFKQDEFANHDYSKAYKNCLEIIKTALCKS